MPVIFRDREVINKMRPRIDKDVYETPEKLALRCVAEFYNIESVLDPGAGSGVWGRAVRTLHHNAVIYGLDVRDIPRPMEYFSWITNDYLSWHTNAKFDLIIGNPPFILAEEFIFHSRQFLNPYGHIAFLLPTQFQHTVGRGTGLFTVYKPQLIYSLMQRPNFTGPEGEPLGKANTDDYIFGVWGKETADFCKHEWMKWK